MYRSSRFNDKKKCLFSKLEIFFLYFSCTCATGVYVYMDAKLCFYLFSCRNFIDCDRMMLLL